MFLGEMLLRLVLHGKSSVSFVRIFSFFLSYIKFLRSPLVGWPSVPEYEDELIEALIAKKTPFITLTATFDSE